MGDQCRFAIARGGFNEQIAGFGLAGKVGDMLAFEGAAHKNGRVKGKQIGHSAAIVEAGVGGSLIDVLVAGNIRLWTEYDLVALIKYASGLAAHLSCLLRKHLCQKSAHKCS